MDLNHKKSKRPTLQIRVRIITFQDPELTDLLLREQK